jgi:hypothetical protein
MLPSHYRNNKKAYCSIDCCDEYQGWQDSANKDSFSNALLSKNWINGWGYGHYLLKNLLLTCGKRKVDIQSWMYSWGNSLSESSNANGANGCSLHQAIAILYYIALNG